MKSRVSSISMIEIVSDSIDIKSVVRNVEDPSAGAIDVFIGVTRNRSEGKEVQGLEYQAYSPMAVKMMHRIADEASEKFGVTRISIVHRVGMLRVGEPSVVIAVSSAHRKEAFEACRFVIDTLKKSVPIWKKEYFSDGSHWVEGKDGSEEGTAGSAGGRATRGNQS